MTKSIKISNNLSISNDFFEFLNNASGIIPSIILNLETNSDINYISPTENPNMVSYLSMKKFKTDLDFDPFNNSNRTYLKIGRLVNKLIPEKIIKAYRVVDSINEIFTNQYKSWFDKSSFQLKVVSGEEIRKWYNEQNYYRPNGNCIGPLWNSCMRHYDRLKYLDMYCMNPNVKMLVLIDSRDNNERVRCRALLWDNVSVIKSNGEVPSVINIMDRIYSVVDSDIVTFKRWAFENGYIPKYEQNSKSHLSFDIKGNPTIISTKIQLENFKLNHYPYLDTFPYFDYNSGELFNSEFIDTWQYKLIQTNGQLERQEDSEPAIVDDDDW